VAIEHVHDSAITLAASLFNLMILPFRTLGDNVVCFAIADVSIAVVFVVLWFTGAFFGAENHLLALAADEKPAFIIRGAPSINF
jgi:hypothetical protein